VKLGTKLFFATMTVLVAGAITYRIVNGPTRLRAPKFLRGDKGLRGVYEAGTFVSTDVLDLVHPEIDTDALAGKGVNVEPKVVNLAPKAQVQAYEISERLWMAPDFDGEKADLVKRVLQSIAPHTSWHVPREELEDDGARARVWDGVAWIVEVMGASAEEEAREAEKTASGGAP
jgi:hypothetical protein